MRVVQVRSNQERRWIPKHQPEKRQKLGCNQESWEDMVLKLAASSVRAVYLIRDKIGISNARKAMIRCGLSLDVTGQWHAGQLSSELQTIIKKHRKFFDGSVVPPFGSSAADREESSSEEPAHSET
jgi:hypothetical protein